MNQRRNFLRKLAYIPAFAVLLLLLSWLSQPTVKDADGRTIPGGVLAQKRDAYQLSQGSLGEIDPASETIKLATLGMRGIAANILWEQAHEYKKKEDWTGLSATLEQISRLQPNVVSVWRYQAWNLSYNTSVEFDNYEHRYYWVMKGIKFLQEGTNYNRNEPMLLWDMGWFLGQKIGRADEHIQYRRLFKADDDFHGSRHREERDNWLVGREYFLQAEKAALRKASVLKALNPFINELDAYKGSGPLVFHSNAPMCLINYSEVLEEEGRFGEQAKIAWRKAGEAWNEYGKLEIPSTYNISIRLNDKERLEVVARQAREELAKIVPAEVVETLRIAKVNGLTEKEREALETPTDRRTGEQMDIMPLVESKIEVTPLEIAQKIGGNQRAAALKAGETASQAEFVADIIDRYREIVNFDYWRLRCQVESDDDAIAARELIHRAHEARRGGKLVPEEKFYEEGFKKWRTVLDKYPGFVGHNTVIEDLATDIERYRTVLQDVDRTKDLPKPFILQDVLDAGTTAPKKPASVPLTDPEKK